MLQRKSTWVESREQASDAVDVWTRFTVGGFTGAALGMALVWTTGSALGALLAIIGYTAVGLGAVGLRPLARYLKRFGSNAGARVIQGVMVAGASAVVLAAAAAAEIFIWWLGAASLAPLLPALSMLVSIAAVVSVVTAIGTACLEWAWTRSLPSTGTNSFGALSADRGSLASLSRPLSHPPA